MGLFLLYTPVVYALGLTIHPLGRDYAAMADSASVMDSASSALFETEMELFDASPAGYHVVNLLLLLACMACIYGAVRKAIQGPYWLGALAGLLFMANPVHSEAVLNLSGVSDLFPAVFALAAFWAYTVHVDRRSISTYASTLLLFTPAVVLFEVNLPLVAVFLMYETYVAPDHKRSYLLLLPLVAVTVVAGFYQNFALDSDRVDLAGMFVPLYFILYPIGFLPESAETYLRSPIQAWAAVGAAVVVLSFIAYKSRSGVVWFGLLGPVAYRLFQGQRTVDPTHLVGGGQLLVANGLFVVGLVALFYRIMHHPKWRGRIVVYTTILCAAFFVLQFRSVLAWREAGTRVARWQTDIQDFPKNGVLGLFPDYQYFRGAPLLLSEAISYETPFSAPVAHRSLLKLHYAPAGQTVRITSWSPSLGVIEIERDPIVRALPYPYYLNNPSLDRIVLEAVLNVVERNAESLKVEIAPGAGDLPSQTFPVSSTNNPAPERSRSRTQAPNSQ